MKKRVAIFTQEQSEQPFQTRDALAQYVLHVMEERMQQAKNAKGDDTFSGAIHLHLSEMASGDRITV